MEVNDLGRKPVKQSAAEARSRRERLAAEYNDQLIRDLKLAETPTAAQCALIASATSAYVQTCELSAQFLRGNASPDQLRALGLARGQLCRVLRLLGLLSGDPNEPDEGAVETLANWIRARTQAPPAGAQASSQDPEAPR